MDHESLVIWGSLLIWLAAITLFFILMRSLLARLSRLFHTRMRTSMEAAEIIVRTGQAPAAWRQRFLPTDPWPNQLQAVWDCFAPSEPDLEALCLDRLEHLIRFFETSPIVQGPDARSLLLTELRARQVYWKRHGVSMASALEPGGDRSEDSRMDDKAI